MDYSEWIRHHEHSMLIRHVRTQLVRQRRQKPGVRFPCAVRNRNAAPGFSTSSNNVKGIRKMLQQPGTKRSSPIPREPFAEIVLNIGERGRKLVPAETVGNDPWIFVRLNRAGT